MSLTLFCTTLICPKRISSAERFKSIKISPFGYFHKFPLALDFFFCIFSIKGFEIRGDEISPIIHLHLNEDLPRHEIEAKLDSYVDKVITDMFVFGILI